MAKEEILAAIRRAAEELGRAPSRGELRRITGVSHYRVLAEFPTLREAVRAAGLEPNPKGEKISTEDLLADWKRVAEKLGRRPSRAEYVREGKYSAGALTVRFGSWSGISTAKNAKGAKKSKIGRESLFNHTGRRTRINQTAQGSNHKGHEETRRRRSGGAKSTRGGNAGEFTLHNFDCAPVAQLPAPLVGMRRVTEAVAQMVVNTLLSPANARAAFAGGPDFANSNWQLAIGQNQNQGFNHKEHPYDSSFASLESLRAGYGTQREIVSELARRDVRKEGDLGPSLAVTAPLVQDDGLMRRDLTRRGVKKDRAVMGEPFDRSPMTNAPVNELGVMVLFGMMAAGLGLQGNRDWIHYDVYLGGPDKAATAAAAPYIRRNRYETAIGSNGSVAYCDDYAGPEQRTLQVHPARDICPGRHRRWQWKR